MAVTLARQLTDRWRTRPGREPTGPGHERAGPGRGTW